MTVISVTFKLDDSIDTKRFVGWLNDECNQEDNIVDHVNGPRVSVLNWTIHPEVTDGPVVGEQHD